MITYKTLVLILNLGAAGNPSDVQILQFYNCPPNGVVVGFEDNTHGSIKGLPRYKVMSKCPNQITIYTHWYETSLEVLDSSGRRK